MQVIVTRPKELLYETIALLMKVLKSQREASYITEVYFKKQSHLTSEEYSEFKLNSVHSKTNKT